MLMVVPTMKRFLPLVVQKELSLNGDLQGVEGNLSWFYVLIRKIEGSILANILNLDSLVGREVRELLEPVKDDGIFSTR